MLGNKYIIAKINSFFPGDVMFRNSNTSTINQIFKKVASFAQSLVNNNFFFPSFLLIIISLSYGILIPSLGFSGDDWALLWDSYRINEFGFISFRPLVVLIYQVLRFFLSPVPSQWFITVILFRWLGGLAVYFLIKELIPNFQSGAGLFAILYSLYPGFIVGYIPLQILAPMLQPFFLFISFYLMVIWIKRKNNHYHWLLLIFSFLAAAINLMLTEYFFFLELLRPIIIRLAIVDQNKPKPIKIIFRIWLPYLIIFIAALFWRVSFIGISNPYDAILVSDIFASPLTTLTHLFNTVVHVFYATILQPIFEAFQSIPSLGPRTLILYLVLVAFIGFSVFIYLSFGFRQRKSSGVSFSWPLLLLVFGILAFFLASMSFWVAGLHIIYGFDVRNRFSMTQAFTFTLLLFIPILIIQSHNRIYSILLASILAGVFSGAQLIGANNFRNEWSHQEEFFWNFAWRVPDLKPGSVVIMNVPDFHTIGDNALSAAINWNYVKNPRPNRLDYYVYFDDFHLKLDIPDFKNLQQFSSSHIIGDFVVNTNQTLVIRFVDPSCLRILDPEVDIFNPDITDFTQKYMQYTNLGIIQADHYSQTGPLDRSIFRSELPHGWCYYFEKADLARQLKDWVGIDELGTIAFSLDEHPNNAAEYLPFIEGYAHLGKWDKAIQLSNDSIEISLEYKRMNCALWKRINNSTQNTPEKNKALEIISNLASCTFE